MKYFGEKFRNESDMYGNLSLLYGIGLKVVFVDPRYSLCLLVDLGNTEVEE